MEKEALQEADKLVNQLERQLEEAKSKAKQYEGAQQALEEMVNSGNAMLMDDGKVRPIVLDPNSGDHYVSMGAS